MSQPLVKYLSKIAKQGKRGADIAKAANKSVRRDILMRFARSPEATSETRALVDEMLPKYSKGDSDILLDTKKGKEALFATADKNHDAGLFGMWSEEGQPSQEELHHRLWGYPRGDYDSHDLNKFSILQRWLKQREET